MMRYSLSIVFILMMSSFCLHAQEEKDKPPFKDRLVFGGDVVLSFSNNFTAIGGTPLIGYKVSDRYVAGLGYTYIYQGNSNVSINYHGPRVFNRFYPLPELFAHAEFEHLTIKERVKVSNGEDLEFKTSFPALLVGGGYRQRIADRVYISFMALYDVIEDPDSFYNGIVIRGGVGVGF
ncbi:MAG: hypothetical protein HKN79_06795 [Flavobacteriales bacterium]|nr:hypothetical protein [Flavobacteriales bacterium]